MNTLQRFINWINKQRLKQGISKIIKYRNIEGWLSDYEVFGLYSVARKVKPNGIIVEIDTWKGKSTFCLAKGLKRGKIFAIDPFNIEGEPGSSEIYVPRKGEKPLII